MKRLFYSALPLFFIAVLAPGQAYACGDSDCKDATQEQTATKQQTEKKSCCENTDSSASCCQKDETGHASDHDCNGQCSGKCGGHCTCPTVHSGAAFFGDFSLRFPPSQLVFTSFYYTTPFLSNVSLDIWLPPDNPA